MTKKLFLARHKETQAEIEFDLWDIFGVPYFNHGVLSCLVQPANSQLPMQKITSKEGYESRDLKDWLKDYDLFLQLNGELIPYKEGER
jgi:hypothetical protein